MQIILRQPLRSRRSGGGLRRGGFGATHGNLFGGDGLLRAVTHTVHTRHGDTHRVGVRCGVRVRARRRHQRVQRLDAR